MLHHDGRTPIDVLRKGVDCPVPYSRVNVPRVRNIGRYCDACRIMFARFDGFSAQIGGKPSRGVRSPVPNAECATA